MSPSAAEIHRRIVDHLVNQADPVALRRAAGAGETYRAHLRRLRLRAFVKRLPVVGDLARLARDAWRRARRPRGPA